VKFERQGIEMHDVSRSGTSNRNVFFVTHCASDLR
jgi:hypothetical protein